MNEQGDHLISPVQVPAQTAVESEPSQSIVDSNEQGASTTSLTRDDQQESTALPSPAGNVINESSPGDTTTCSDPISSLSHAIPQQSTTKTQLPLPPSNNPEVKALGTNTSGKRFQPLLGMISSNDDDDDGNDKDERNQASQIPTAEQSCIQDDSSLSSSQFQSTITSQQPQPPQSLNNNMVNFCPTHPTSAKDQKEDDNSSIHSMGSYIGPTMIDRDQHAHAEARITDTVRFEYNRRISLVRDFQTGRESTRAHRATRLPAQPKGFGGIRQRRQQQQHQPQSWDDPGTHSIRNLPRDLSSQNRRPFLPIASLRGRFVANRMTSTDDDRAECFQDDSSDILVSRHVATPRPVQYRLEAFDARLHGTITRAIRRGITSTHEDSVRFEPVQNVYGFRPNMTVVRYLNWTFRTSFFMVSLSACAAHFAITLLFAAAMVVIGHSKPDCIQVAGQPFSTTGGFLDAYALSWTTFSTVGYGAIFPGISTATSNIMSCTGITILTTLESFLGILFSSFWAAVFYAKVGRVASFAPVQFCDPVVIRYGTGVMTPDDESSDEELGLHPPTKGGGGDDDDGSDSHESGPKSDHSFHFVPSKLLCPLLEFRVVNHRWARLGGEIIEATLNAVASIDESQAADALRGPMRGPRRRGKKGRRRLGLRRGGAEGVKDDSAMPPTRERLEKARKDVELMINKHRNRHAMKEYPTGRLLPKKIFTKLEIQSYDHPFFKRVWLVRHVLDQFSPLLRPEAKELIRLNGGHWPMELNSAEGVRASVSFDQIVVSLSGISNADANSVYKQKVYDYVDVCVGYQFSDMLFRQHDGSIGVDTRLLNDVKEQRGGGGEDLLASTRKDHVPSDNVLIL